MSLLSPELRIALLPGAAALTRGDRVETARAGEDFEGALRALDALLGARRDGFRARVTLSHHFARLFLLTAPPAWLGQEEMRVWLGAQLASTLELAEWRLAWQPTPPGRPLLVAAAAQANLAQLGETLARHRMRLAATRPWLADAWRARGHRLGRVDGWYALLEPARATFARLRRGQAMLLRQRPLDSADPAADLGRLLARESLLAGLASGGGLWLECAGVAADWSALAGYQPRLLANTADAAPGLLA